MMGTNFGIFWPQKGKRCALTDKLISFPQSAEQQQVQPVQTHFFTARLCCLFSRIFVPAPFFTADKNNQNVATFPSISKCKHTIR